MHTVHKTCVFTCKYVAGAGRGAIAEESLP